MQETKRVKNPRKQRKMLFNAPAHVRHKLMGAPLSSDLAASRGTRTLPVRKGDTVRILRGDNKGFEGKVSKVDLKHFRIYIEGLTREKVDGTNIFVAVHPSKVQIRNLNLSDNWRKDILGRKKEIEKPAKEEKPKAKAAKKVEKPRVKAEKAKEEVEKPAEQIVEKIPEEVPVVKKEEEAPVAKKAPAKKPAAKKTAAKKKEAPAKKKPVKEEAPVEEEIAPAKKAAKPKSAAKKTAASKEAPAKETASKKTAAKPRAKRITSEKTEGGQ